MKHLGVEVRLDRYHDHLGEFLSITSIWLGKDFMITTNVARVFFSSKYCII